MMNRIADIVEAMKANPRGVKFKDVAKVCVHYFGVPRQRSTSHQVYKMPWSGDPRVNIQSDKGMAKEYQVKQVLKAIEKLETTK